MKLSFLLISALTGFSLQSTSQPMKSNDDISALSKLNAQFIKNFVSQDAVAHDQIIHKDFVCIESNGQIVMRDQYLKDWAHGYQDSRYTSFSYEDEFIRVFENAALIRSKTVYTKVKDGATIKGYTIYTDTYVKENGKWLCVQAQITPVVVKP